MKSAAEKTQSSYKKRTASAYAAEDFDSFNSPNTLSLPTRRAGKILIVVPFRFLDSSGDAAASYDKFLGIGLADALVLKLSRIRQINVRPTSSVLRFSEQNLETPAICAELQGDFAIEGHILRIGKRMRVSVQLLKAEDQSVVWAAHFDENETDVFRLQDLIAEKAAAAIVPQLTSETDDEPAFIATSKAAALETYLCGRAHWQTYTIQGVSQSIAYFHEAISHDPDFALAYTGIADYYNWIAVAGVLPPAECFTAAKEAALRAIELDSRSAEAYASFGFATWAYTRNAVEADEMFRRAIRLNPSYPQAHEWYALLLSSNGRHDEALAEIEIAEQLLPDSSGIKAFHAFLLHFARRFDESLLKTRSALEIDPDHYISLQGLGWSYPHAAALDEALDGCRRAVADTDEFGFNKWTLGTTLAAAGQSAEAREIAEELAALSRRRYIPPYFPALIYACLGENDLAFEWLERSYAARDFWLNWIEVEPRFDSLRQDARFASFAEKIRCQDDERATLDLIAPAETSEISAPTPKTFTNKTRRLVAFCSVIALAALFCGAFYFRVSQEVAPEKNLAAVAAPRKDGSPQTLAILPFDSRNGAQNILGAGLADALTNNLGTIKQISVLSSKSGLAASKTSPQAVSKELKADFILRGALEKSDGKIHITAELYGASKAEILWKEKFTANDFDLLDLQNVITERIIGALEIELTTDERNFIVKRHTTDLRAYELYLLGRRETAVRTAESLDKAIGLFSEAIGRDTSFALGYAGLADAFALRNRMPKAPANSIKIAEENALKAISLDETLAEAHAALGLVYHSGGINSLDKSLAHYRRAIEINPSYAEARQRYAQTLIYLGKYQEALEQSQRAAELEPNWAPAHTTLATIYTYLRNYDEAVSECEKALAIDSNFLSAYLNLRFIYQSKGDYHAALEAEKKAESLKLYKNEIESLMSQAKVQAVEGDRKNVKATIKQILDKPQVKKDLSSFAYEIGHTLALAGEHEEALSWLKKSRLEFVPRVDPRFDHLLSDIRFVEVLNDLRIKPLT